MKYFKQFCMILLVSFAGEVLKLALPFPVPGSIYGMLLLFIALCTGVIRLEHVRETGLFLVETCRSCLFLQALDSGFLGGSA